MSSSHQPVTEVWAQLSLCKADVERIREFLVLDFGIREQRIVRHMHITVYYARRPMPGVLARSETASLTIPTADTRFMVMAPGGENPRPDLRPSERKVGIRIRRPSSAMSAILTYRHRLLSHETSEVRGVRRPSDHRRNAFGARHFQAHMSILRPGSGIAHDLKPLGAAFRAQIPDLHFDRFLVDISLKPLHVRNAMLKDENAVVSRSHD